MRLKTIKGSRNVYTRTITGIRNLERKCRFFYSQKIVTCSAELHRPTCNNIRWLVIDNIFVLLLILNQRALATIITFLHYKGPVDIEIYLMCLVFWINGNQSWYMAKKNYYLIESVVKDRWVKSDLYIDYLWLYGVV